MKPFDIELAKQGHKTLYDIKCEIVKEAENEIDKSQFVKEEVYTLLNTFRENQRINFIIVENGRAKVITEPANYTIVEERISCLKQVEQKKNEWSEEDERICQCLIEDQENELNEVKNDKYGHSEIISDLKEMYRERIHWLESLKTKKSTNEIKQKFKVGDWITFYGGGAFKILKIEAEDNGILDYLLLGPNGHDSFYNKEYVDRNARLWTVLDAKDGDVLEFADHGRIVIGIVSYVNKVTGKVDVNCLLEGDNFKIGNYNNLDTIKPHPATKEQCDHLFQKVRELGYEWDDKIKELKKIE